MNLPVQGGAARCEQPLGKLAHEVRLGLTERGGLRVEERMVKAASGDARCGITYRATKNITER